MFSEARVEVLQAEVSGGSNREFLGLLTMRARLKRCRCDDAVCALQRWVVNLDGWPDSPGRILSEMVATDGMARVAVKCRMTANRYASASLRKIKHDHPCRLTFH